MSQVELPHAAWRLIKGQSLRYRVWDDEAVLYNDISGATHLLGPAALCVLDTLRPGPAPMAALAARLLEEFEIDDASIGAELDALLDELSQLSLIEPCRC